MKPQQLAAVIGFLFVAAWIAFDFGDAILCILGAAAFYIGVAIYEGELDLSELQARAQRRNSTPR